MEPKDKALELIDKFKSHELAYACTEECVGALYDEGIREPEYWYQVQREIDNHKESLHEDINKMEFELDTWYKVEKEHKKLVFRIAKIEGNTAYCISSKGSKFRMPLDKALPDLERGYIKLVESRIRQLQILLLKEKLEKLTGKKVKLQESAQDIYNIIQSTKVDENGSWVVDSPDFQLKYDDKGDFMFSWIYMKTSKYRGTDVFKALLMIAQKEGAKEINALAAKGKTNDVLANGYYTLIKWGFVPVKDIDWANKLLGTQYQSWDEAYSDPKFFELWKTKGKEVYVTFDTTPGSLSMKTFSKYK